MLRKKSALCASVCATALFVGMPDGRAADLFTDMTRPVGPKFYISVLGGAAFPEDVSGDYLQPGTTFRYDLNLDTGFVVGGAVGVELFENVRTEVEFSYSEWAADDAVYSTTTGAFPYALNGDVSAIYILGNVWYDLPVDLGGIQPFIGGGAGVGLVNYDVAAVAGGFGPDGRDTGFAFQAGAGLRYPFSEMLTFEVSYRFRGIIGLDDFDDSATPAEEYDDLDIFSHNVIAGISLSIPPM